MRVLRGIVDRLSSEEEGVYECQGCGAAFEHQRQVCPRCGGYHIDRTDWER